MHRPRDRDKDSARERNLLCCDGHLHNSNNAGKLECDIIAGIAYNGAGMEGAADRQTKTNNTDTDTLHTMRVRVLFG